MALQGLFLIRPNARQPLSTNIRLASRAGHQVCAEQQSGGGGNRIGGHSRREYQSQSQHPAAGKTLGPNPRVSAGLSFPPDKYTTRAYEFQEPHHNVDLVASFWRGGTSKGVFLDQRQLQRYLYHVTSNPIWEQSHIRWEDHSNDKTFSRLLQSILGSPDAKYGRQLNGLGGGISSLSKAVIFRPAQLGDDEADMEYTFIQVGVDDSSIDMTGNCGNLTSVIGPIALETKLYRPSVDRFDFTKAVRLEEIDSPEVGQVTIPITIRLRNTNTRKVIQSSIYATPRRRDRQWWAYQERGSYAIDGVGGTNSRIRLKFIDPGGSKTGKVLPTGNPVDTIEIAGRTVQASLVDIANPGIFVAGADFDWDPSRTPEELNANKGLLDLLEQVRQAGSRLMGLDSRVYKATPKIVLVWPASSESVHIESRAISMQMAHKAIPGTLALNLGAACKIPGSIPHQLARQDGGEEVDIGHASGKVEVGAEVKDGEVLSVELSRTARFLMLGKVNTFDPFDRITSEVSLNPEEVRQFYFREKQ